MPILKSLFDHLVGAGVSPHFCIELAFIDIV
jgi:hypothetical protein